MMTMSALKDVLTLLHALDQRNVIKNANHSEVFGMKRTKLATGVTMRGMTLANAMKVTSMIMIVRLTVLQLDTCNSTQRTIWIVSGTILLKILL